MTLEKVDHTNAMMATNFWGTFNMMKAFYPLVNQNGRIVNLSSMQAQRAMAIFPLTAESKGPEFFLCSVSKLSFRTRITFYKSNIEFGTIRRTGYRI